MSVGECLSLDLGCGPDAPDRHWCFLCLGAGFLLLRAGVPYGPSVHGGRGKPLSVNFSHYCLLLSGYDSCIRRARPLPYLLHVER
eukprot:3496236-Amphidinium_carterae.3